MVKKKIVIIVDDITKRAGIERATANLSNMLQKSGKYQINIISTYSKGDVCLSYNVDHQVKIIHMGLQGVGTKQRFANYILVGKKVKNLVDSQNIDFIIGTTHAYNCILAWLFPKKNTIGCEHFNYDACTWKSKAARVLSYARLSAVVLLTKNDAMNYWFVKKQNRYVIPNSVSFACEQVAPLKVKRIITMGRLTKQKGYDILIEIAELLKTRIPDWSIDIFGSGEDEQFLRKEIKKRNLGDFININANTKQVKEELTNSSIYVLTSRYEGLPMTLIEAQECGLPIVAFNCKEGPGDIVTDGENGFLVEQGNISTFVDRVCDVAENEELRRKLGKNAKRDAKRFSEDEIFLCWENLFDRINKGMSK